MELSELRRLVQQGEGQRLEFKRKAAHPEKIVREMVAFANTDGGILLIGVEDDKTIYGCKYPDEEVFAITEHIRQYCPTLPYRLELLAINQKREVPIFYVSAAAKLPIYLRNAQNPAEKAAFIRIADKSVRASIEMEHILRYKNSEKDVVFQYGKREETLLKYLEKEEVITVAEAQKLLQLPRKPVSITLVTLVRANILRVFPTEQGDYFTLQPWNEGE